MLTGNNVLLGTHQVADGFLLDVRKVFVELVGKTKCHDWQTGVVSFARRPFFILLFARFVLEVSLFAVNIADAAVPALC